MFFFSEIRGVSINRGFWSIFVPFCSQITKTLLIFIKKNLWTFAPSSTLFFPSLIKISKKNFYFGSGFWVFSVVFFIKNWILLSLYPLLLSIQRPCFSRIKVHAEKLLQFGPKMIVAQLQRFRISFGKINSSFSFILSGPKLEQFWSSLKNFFFSYQKRN